MKNTTSLLPLLLALALLSVSAHGNSGEGDNPYVFGKESFEYRVRSEHGRVGLLKRFSNLSPNLLRIENYRLGLLEAEPLTFVMPTHLDADSIFYVIDGEGAVSILHEGNRESHCLERGDIIRVWAGSIIYLINKSHDRKLRVAKLLQAVGNTGDVEAFYSAGGEESGSYYQSFSIELLEAALNTKRDKLQRFFAQNKREVIIKASEEKIRAIARQAGKSEGGPWPFTRSKKPFNLLGKRPSHQNNRGQLYEADSNDYDQLRDLNARVSHANISGGSMVAPFFNTRAFKIALVEEGSGYLEIICPHVEGRRGGEERQREREQGREEHGKEKQGSKKYTRVSSLLSEGSVYVIPPGHPTTIVAGRGKNLRITCFELPAENNERVYLSGRNSILREMEDAAKELAFGVPAKAADEVLSGQKEEVFLPGPEEWREERGRGHGGMPVQYSVLEVAAGF